MDHLSSNLRKKSSRNNSPAHPRRSLASDMYERGTAFDSPRRVSMSAEHLIDMRASAVYEPMQGMTFCSNSRLRSPHIMLVRSGAVGGPEGIGLA